MLRSIVALLISAVILALGIPELRERIAFRLRIFAICRVGWAIQFYHQPVAIIKLTERTTYEKFCARCNKTLADGPIPPAEQAVVDKMLQMVEDLEPLDMGMPVVDQQGWMH